MDNRRNFARVDHQILVSYTHHGASGDEDAGAAKTLNMSVHGLLLLLPRAVDAGARLQLALDLDGEIVEVVGRVAHCEPDPGDSEMFDVGVALEYVPEHFVEVVERYFSPG